MIGVIIGLVLVAADPHRPDPTILVGELGSPRYRQREAAEAALSRLGRVAIPSLRAALEAKDPEIRLRATAILSRIEEGLLVEPTPISFDFVDVPVVDAIRTINQQSGLSLRIVPEGNPMPPSHRLTLQTSEPLPFWSGVDALCRAAGLHHDLGAAQPNGRREPGFLLYDGPAPAPAPASDSGPFRTQLASVHYQSEIQLTRPRAGLPPGEVRPGSADQPGRKPSAPNRQFFLQLVTAAEPRLTITRNGDPRVTEAFDDLGKSLLVPSNRSTLQRSSGYFGVNASTQVRLRVDLAYPASTGRRIARLKGSIPLIVATRKPEPLRVPVEGAAGRTFRNADADLTIREVRESRETQPWSIELSLKPLGSPTAPAGVVDPVAARFETPQDQLEVLDADGEPLAWFPSRSTFNGEETRLTLSLTPRNKASKPATIAYHGMTRMATEVPFEFRDVPIP